MSERITRAQQHDNIIRLAPSRKTANTITNAVFGHMRNPSHVAAMALLYANGVPMMTSDMTCQLGFKPHDSLAYVSLYGRTGDKVSAVEKVNKHDGNRPRYQEGWFTSEAETFKYPQLCVLAMNWAVRYGENRIDPVLLLKSRIDYMPARIKNLVELYLHDDPAVKSQKAMELLNRIANAELTTKKKGEEGFFSNIVRSLKEKGFVTGSSENSTLNNLGRSFVEEVVVPYATLLVDPEFFATNSEMATYKRQLLLDPNERDSEVMTLKTRAKILAAQVSRSK